MYLKSVKNINLQQHTNHKFSRQVFPPLCTLSLESLGAKIASLADVMDQTRTQSPANLAVN